MIMDIVYYVRMVLNTLNMSIQKCIAMEKKDGKEKGTKAEPPWSVQFVEKNSEMENSKLNTTKRSIQATRFSTAETANMPQIFFQILTLM